MAYIDNILTTQSGFDDCRHARAAAMRGRQAGSGLLNWQQGGVTTVTHGRYPTVFSMMSGFLRSPSRAGNR
jgi:hypothetical protein